MVSSKNWIRLQSQAMCSKSQSGSSISHIEFEQDIKVLAKNLRSLLKKGPNICRERSAKTNHLGEKLAFTLQHGFPAFWFTPSLYLPFSHTLSLFLCAGMGVENEGTFGLLPLSVSHNSKRTSVLDALSFNADCWVLNSEHWPRHNTSYNSKVFISDLVLRGLTVRASSLKCAVPEEKIKYC